MTLSPTLPETEAPVQAPTRSIDDVLFAVKVDQEDIQLGVRANGEHCAIARAVRRTLTLAGYTPTFVSVNRNFASMRVSRANVCFEHSGRVFVDRYDELIPVEPCVVNFTRRSER